MNEISFTLMAMDINEDTSSDIRFILRKDGEPLSSAAIRYLLAERGVPSLRKLGMQHGYSPSSCKRALVRPWPPMERIIADAIGVEPWEIWPDRYLNKQPKQPFYERPRRRAYKHNTQFCQGNKE